MTDTTARIMLPQLQGCFHQAPADLQAIIDAGQGDRPLKDLKFRCTACGRRRTNSVVMSRDAESAADFIGLHR